MSIRKTLAVAVALAAAVANPVRAQERLDIERPVYLRAQQPFCHTASDLADVLILAIQGAFEEAAKNDACLALRQSVRAYIMQRAGEAPLVAYRLRIRLPSTGDSVNVWAMEMSLTNRRP